MKREQCTTTCYGLIFGFRGAEVHYLNEVLHINLIRDKDLASAAGDCVDKRRKTNDENRVQGGSGALSNICKDLIPISVKRPVYGYQRAHFDTLPRAMTSFNKKRSAQQPCTEQIHHLAHYTNNNSGSKSIGEPPQRPKVSFRSSGYLR